MSCRLMPHVVRLVFAHGDVVVSGRRYSPVQERFKEEEEKARTDRRRAARGGMVYIISLARTGVVPIRFEWSQETGTLPTTGLWL